ncbi:MAG: ribonuclease, partial [Alphaproteobacteria bacterium]|nr:ribonuclease [Alphaproteobacteria bacterium]
MAEWLVERGIGEDRAIFMQGGEIVAARLDWPGALASGQVEDVVLVS